MNRPTPLILASVAIFTVAPSAGAADALAENIRLIDGNSIEIGGQNTRLHTIDAPDWRQWCETLDTDRYGRAIAHFYSGDGAHVRAELVRRGLAWAYLRYAYDYIGEEEDARDAQRGVWASPNVPPWEWRRR